MKKLFLLAGALFLFGISAISPAAAQQPAPPAGGSIDAQILREIVSELKQLRALIAKTNLNQLRFQTTFEQYKSQQNRVDGMNREMDSIKNMMSAGNPLRVSSEEMIKTSEERLLQTTDQRVRQTLERQIQGMKRNLESQEQREKRMKERQTTLEMQIPFEQSKLEQLNMELERIKQDINALLNQ